MSFSYDIKTKLSQYKNECEFCKIAELYGIMNFASSEKRESIMIITEHEAVFKRIGDMFLECIGFMPDKKDYSGGFRYDISDKIKYELTEERLHLNDELSLYKDEIMPFDCCVTSYIRGAFLGGGSVSNPNKNYHLEFDARTKAIAENLKNALVIHGIPVKITERKKRYIVYIKGYEDIASVMGLIGAGAAAMEIYNISIEKEIRNGINRQMNCENANIDRISNAYIKHMHAIEKIKNTIGFENLPNSLSEVAKIRMEFPEESLKELGERLNPKIGKSGVNHRLNRIMEIADKI